MGGLRSRIRELRSESRRRVGARAAAAPPNRHNRRRPGMKTRTFVGASAVCAAMATVAIACSSNTTVNQASCGPGTTLIDGTCVVVDGGVDSTSTDSSTTPDTTTGSDTTPPEDTGTTTDGLLTDDGI